MTKQEIIREGIARIEGSYVVADALLTYLDAQGAVLKVDRELPVNPYMDKPEQGSWERQVFIRGMRGMLDAGYVAVIPLVEEQ